MGAAIPPLGARISATILDCCRPAGPRPLEEPDSSPLISCLMVTRDRPEQAALAIECFTRQSYPVRELLILDGSETEADRDRLAGVVERALESGAKITLSHQPQTGRTLGELRNLGVERASGAYVATWDDDDLSDPSRLQLQHQALRRAGASACLLHRAMLWAPNRRLLGAARLQRWDNTMLCAKGALPSHPPISVGEDTAVVDELMASSRVVLLDHPRLYVSVFHGANTTGDTALAVLWSQVDHSLEGAGYDAMLAELADRVPIAAYRKLVDEPATAQPPAKPAAGAARLLADSRLRERVLEMVRAQQGS